MNNRIYKVDKNVENTVEIQKDIKYTLDKIRETLQFGIFKEDVDIIISRCKQIQIKNPNVYFDNLISDLESKLIYSLDDIYVTEDLSRIKRFLSAQ